MVDTKLCPEESFFLRWNTEIIKMTKLKNNVEKLNTLIREGKIMEAFEKYYGENVVIQVNGN